MSFLPVIIGIALSMDFFAVSLALGTATKNKLMDTAIIIALCFGLFQTGMVLAGWAAGTRLLMYIAGFDHWLAFLLLALIGIKMIIEGIEAGDEKEPVFVLRIIPVIVLSIASIDSLGRNFFRLSPCRYSDPCNHYRHSGIHILICRCNFRYPA